METDACQPNVQQANQTLKICVPKLLKKELIKLKDNVLKDLAFGTQRQGNKLHKMRLQTLL